MSDFKKCPFCQCEFLTDLDLVYHLEAFGRRNHHQKFVKWHEDVELTLEKEHGGADKIIRELAWLVKHG